MKQPVEFEHLVDALKSLPGVGTKNAKKWAYFLLNQDEKYINDFIYRIRNAFENVRKCEECGNLSMSSKCNICTSNYRDKQVVCVVATPEDLDRIESSGHFNGIYHVTHGELSIRKNVLVQHTNLDSLLPRILNHPEIKEVLIATNFTHDGEMTSAYICDLLKDCDVKIYRIGFGLPLNGQLDYADDETLKYSLSNKRMLK